jgi:glycerophosphoryl diester phosphodiesterase
MPTKPFRRRAALVLAIALAGVGADPAAARILIGSHRGLSASAHPENSIAAVRAAVAAGVDVVEIDLRTTADGAIVLMHDAGVERTTDGAGRVSAMSLARLKALDLGGGERVPTLGEALDLVAASRTRLLLDLKSGGGVDPARLIELVRSRNALDRTIIGVRSARQARAYRTLSPSLTILGFVPALAQVDSFAAAGANIIRLWPRWVLARASGCAHAPSPACLVQRLQKRGLEAWLLADAPTDPAKTSAMFDRLVALGVEAVVTDRPELAARASNRLGTE